MAVWLFAGGCRSPYIAPPIKAPAIHKKKIFLISVEKSNVVIFVSELMYLNNIPAKTNRMWANVSKYNVVEFVSDYLSKIGSMVSLSQTAFAVWQFFWRNQVFIRQSPRLAAACSLSAIKSSCYPDFGWQLQCQCIVFFPIQTTVYVKEHQLLEEFAWQNTF